MESKDQYYLELAAEWAIKGKSKTSPNPLVGAVIVKNNKIIGVGYHQRCGGLHAEINALKQAGTNARNASLYVNLEPCAHFGKTPPCTIAIIIAGIKRVFIGMKDPNPENNGKGINQLKMAGVNVEVAKDPTPYEKINEYFIKYITQKMPYVIAKAGQSLDGKIATRNRDSQWITGLEAREYGQRLRSTVDAIMVGGNTICEDDPFLSCRYQGRLKKKKPIKIIIDSTLKTPDKSNIFNNKKSPAQVVFATTKLATRYKLKKMRLKGAEVIICPTKNNQVDLRFLMKELAKREISSVLVEGGGNLCGSCFDEKLVDKVFFFIAPTIIGGKDAVSSVVGKGIAYLQKAVKLKSMKVTQLKEDIMVEAFVSYQK